MSDKYRVQKQIVNQFNQLIKSGDSVLFASTSGGFDQIRKGVFDCQIGDRYRITNVLKPRWMWSKDPVTKEPVPTYTSVLLHYPRIYKFVE